MATITQDNWTVNYDWSASSGLRLGICDYKGTRVLWSASVPFVYVNYSGGAWGPFTDQLRSTSPTVVTRQIVKGFDIKVSYDLYGEDYLYDHVWRFHDDGQFGSSVIIQGPGEEINGQHTYHIPFRFDLDISGAASDSFQQWTGGMIGTWANVLLEGKLLPGALPSSYYDWRVIDTATSRYAMIRASEADNAEIWALQYSPVENWSSWGGAQPGAPGSPGSVPAIYSTGQSVQNTDVLVWYIAHRSSRDLIASCGPWFKLGGY